jgi:tetrahydromethanopterin S-methyltransferase subunit A
MSDPQLRSLLREAVSMGAAVAEPEHFQAGYVSGHLHGWLNGAIAGLLIGALLTAGAIKLGWWLGDAP